MVTENMPAPGDGRETKTGFGAVFSNIRFMLLWLGQLTSQLADRIFVYVLIIIIYKSTNSNLGVSILFLAFGIPSVLVGPWAGILVDRLNRKWILVVSDVIRGLLILLAIPLLSGSLIWVFLISLLVYTVAQFFSPAEASTIPEVVEKQNLIVANSLFMTTWMASSIVGFGLGAPIVSLLAERNTLVASAILYFVSATAILLISIKARKAVKVNSYVWKDILIGFEFVRRNLIVRYSLIKLFVATSAGGIISMLAISYASDVLKIGERNFGYLIIAFGAGTFIGMLILEWIRHYLKMGRIIVLSFLLSGFILIIMAQAKDIKLALFLILLLGAANIFITSTIQTILQQYTPRPIRGRVFGVVNMLVNSAFTFPIVLFGVVADIWGIVFAISLLGLVTVLTGLIGMFLPEFRTA